MTVPARPNGSYRALVAYLRSETARAGLVRLEALGASWEPTARPDEIVEALARAPLAPKMPDLGTFRARAVFLAGAAWVMAWIARQAEAQVQDTDSR